VRGLILDSTQNDLAINRLAYDSDGSNDLGVPLVCGECTGDTINDAAATDPALRNEQGWNFRAVMASSATTRVIARLLSTQGSSGNGDVNLDRRFKVGVYTANEPFGQSFSAQMRAAAELYGPQRPQPAMVSVETSFHPRDAETNSYEWRQDLDRLSDASPDGIPDAIVVATFAQYHAAFVRSFKGSYNVRVLHAHNFRIDSAIQSLGTLGDEEEGVSAPLVAPGETGETFTSQFTAATGLSPTFLDSVYYDAAAALMLAAVAAGGDDPSQLTGEQLRAGLRTINQPGGEAVGAGADGIARAISALRDGRAINYSGASGPLDFDAQGNVRSLLTHYRSASGKFTELTTFDCITDPECPAQ
jgi:ABC-type branched-subunit amino acid transport system substrate-binding protein